MKKRSSPRADLYMADRAKGMTYKQIAEKYGVSHQAVCHTCGKHSPGHHRIITQKGCIYPNLRKWLNDNMITKAELLRRLERVPVTENYEWIRDCMRGERDIKKSTIDQLIHITGLSYEVLFATDPQEGVQEDG